mmetsp:Transcript_38653/g.99917  ORF Transcript_38653/g.99917 Transcript_38653/m.99917 type:complete len:369 (+) Transcript_38653:327-1433(+)
MPGQRDEDNLPALGCSVDESARIFGALIEVPHHELLLLEIHLLVLHGNTPVHVEIIPDVRGGEQRVVPVEADERLRALREQVLRSRHALQRGVLLVDYGPGVDGQVSTAAAAVVAVGATEVVPQHLRGQRCLVELEERANLAIAPVLVLPLPVWSPHDPALQDEVVLCHRLLGLGPTVRRGVAATTLLLTSGRAWAGGRRRPAASSCVRARAGGSRRIAASSQRRGRVTGMSSMGEVPLHERDGAALQQRGGVAGVLVRGQSQSRLSSERHDLVLTPLAASTAPVQGHEQAVAALSRVLWDDVLHVHLTGSNTSNANIRCWLALRFQRRHSPFVNSTCAQREALIGRGRVGPASRRAHVRAQFLRAAG